MLSTTYEWQQRIDRLHANSEGLRDHLKTQTQIFLTDTSDEGLNKSENVSPYSVLNLTGYPITVFSSEKGIKVDLNNEDIRDIILEKNVEELFSTQIDQNSFDRYKLSLQINHPQISTPCSEPIVIDEAGSRVVRFTSSQQVLPRIVCNIEDKDKKRCITFSSQVQIINCLDIPFMVRIILCE